MQNIYGKDQSNIKEAPGFLQQNEERFHLLVDSVRDYAIFMTDTKGYIVSWNKGAEKIKGYTTNEVVGKHISIFYTEEEIEKKEPENNLKRAAEKGRFETEGWRVRKDGSLFWADVVFTALFDEQGELKGFAKVTRDITKQRKIENEIAHLNETLEKRVIERTEALQKSEKKFHDLFQNNPMAMWVIDAASSKILDVNKAAIRHYGYSRKEFLSMSALDIRPEEEKERYLKLDNTSKTVSYYSGLWKHLKKDGTIIIVEVSADDITFEGKPARLILSNDVTEKTRIEENLLITLRELSDYKYALDESSIVSITDREGIIKHTNNNFCNISKYRAAELIGKNHRLINSGYHPKQYIQHLWATIVNGKIWRGELKNKAKDGSCYWTDTTIVPFLNEKEEPYQYVAISVDITEPKLAEEAMARQARLIDTSFDAILVWEPHGTIIFWNKGATELYGFSAAEAIGQVSHKLLKTNASQAAYFKTELFKRGEWTGELEHITNDGRIVIVESRQRLVQEISGHEIIVETNRDITERKKAEEKIFKLNEEIFRNEKRFRGLIENSHDIVALLNPNSNPPYFYRSPSSYKITGWTDEEIEKSGSLDLVHPEDVSLVKDLIMHVFANPGKSIPITFRSKHKHGHYIWFDGVITNMMHDESINGIVLNLRDVTERKEAEEKLIRSERIYKTIASSIPGSAICIIDNDYRYLLVEGDMLGKLGYSKEQLLGNKIQEILLPEQYAEMLPDFQRVFKDESFTTEGDRGKYHIITRFVPLKDANNKVYAAMVVTIDVTELKKAELHIMELNTELEQKVNKRTEQLESANKELEAFSYSVSHDLRSPLRAVNGYAKILEEEYSRVFDEEGSRLLKTIQYNAKKMGALIDDLLAFSRLGRKEVKKSLVKMTELTRNVIFELQKDLSKNAEIVLSELYPALADHSLITQVMTNLVSNAIKYSSKKEQPIIKISSEKEGDNVVYSVSDNGTGFDMQYAHKLFGVFQRLHGDDFEGTGVGLAIVQRIIVRHGGKIWAEGKLGEGATFYFSLPEH